MIEDSKFVKSVESNAPKKGWKITWQDDKKDNIFDESWLPILDQAQKENRLVHFKKEKNTAGYWNILALELATTEVVTPKLEEPSEGQKVAQAVSPQAVGMWTKEMGDMIRSKYLIPIFGQETASNLISWYRNQAFIVTGVQWKNLPEFKSKQEGD